MDPVTSGPTGPWFHQRQGQAQCRNSQSLAHKAEEAATPKLRKLELFIYILSQGQTL